MPKPITADLVMVAEGEWQKWGMATWNCITGEKSQGFHSDDEDEFAQYVIDTYLPNFFKAPAKWPTAKTIASDDYAWSAVTISYFMTKAGFARKKLLPEKPKPTKKQYADWVAVSGEDQFPISQAHADYIRWSIKAKSNEIETASYWGYRVDKKDDVPEVGDLVCYVRGVKDMSKAKALKFYDADDNYASHSDLVVAKRGGEIDVIGGNVRDSVTKKTLKIDQNGLLVDALQFWFAVMKRR
jgi:hypothetical protein